ncbi:MAG: FAD-binding oxidoreductase, partial [Rhizobium pusense]|nr:FAD-binding oxidoreductase [Agrobacterium pusense]
MVGIVKARHNMPENREFSQHQTLMTADVAPASKSGGAQKKSAEPALKIVRQLQSVLDAKGILLGSGVGEGYCGDATDEKGAVPQVVFRPVDTAGVAAVLATCQESRQPVVVQGGRTGLSGGARP